MLASDIQSPIMRSMGSVGWLAAKVEKAWRRSEAEPEAPERVLVLSFEGGKKQEEG